MDLNTRGYGNPENLKEDIRTLNQILESQGMSFVIDVLAEHAGNVANKFSLTVKDRETAIRSISNELKEALSERL